MNSGLCGDKAVSSHLCYSMALHRMLTETIQRIITSAEKCMQRTSIETLNIATRLLAFLCHIQKVPGSSLNPVIHYPDWDFSRFSFVPPGKSQDSTLNHVLTDLFSVLSNSLIVLLFDAVWSVLMTN
jgi:hypothetical protein